jgi:hypothetical protein
MSYLVALPLAGVYVFNHFKRKNEDFMVKEMDRLLKNFVAILIEQPVAVSDEEFIEQLAGVMRNMDAPREHKIKMYKSLTKEELHTLNNYIKV